MFQKNQFPALLSLVLALTLFSCGSADNAQKTANEQIICAADTKTCADGSKVSRIPPDCEFASCTTITTPPKDFPVTGTIKLQDLKFTNCEMQGKNSQKTCPKSGDLVAKIVTSEGPIWFTLFADLVPNTVQNFTALATQEYYDSLIFHRVIPDFMIQTGDPTGTGRGGETADGSQLLDEFDPELTHLYGAVSMANSGPDTNGSQFFFVQAKDGTSWLDNKHSVFGQVFQGLAVVDKIANAPRDSRDKPTTEIKMESVEIWRVK